MLLPITKTPKITFPVDINLLIRNIRKKFKTYLSGKSGNVKNLFNRNIWKRFKTYLSGISGKGLKPAYQEYLDDVLNQLIRNFWKRFKTTYQEYLDEV